MKLLSLLADSKDRLLKPLMIPEICVKYQRKTSSVFSILLKFISQLKIRENLLEKPLEILFIFA